MGREQGCKAKEGQLTERSFEKPYKNLLLWKLPKMYTYERNLNGVTI